MEYISIGVKLLSMLFPFLRGKDKPRLEIDFDRSEFLRRGIVVNSTNIKVYNHSPKNAYRIEVYINIGANKFKIKRDAMKPADPPIMKNIETELDQFHYYQAEKIFKDDFVIAKYNDDKKGVYYSMWSAKDKKSITPKKQPKELEDFDSPTNRPVLYTRL